MKKTGRATVSACMMVRNEQEMLPRCLDALKDVVDEIVIVDTGSTDRTMEIASSYDKVKIYEHPWEDDFSKHRNQSISYATKDWVLIIDADEELVLKEKVSPEVLKIALAELDPEVCNSAAIILHDIQAERKAVQFTTTRFFRNGYIEYARRVHNQPIIKNGKPHAFLDFVYINHHGYALSPEKMAKKTERTRKLLFEQLKDNPEDWHTYFYLSQNAVVTGKYDEAVAYAEIYVDHKDELRKKGRNNFNVSIYHTLFKCYMYLNRQNMAKETLSIALMEAPGDLDLAIDLVEFGAWANREDLVMLGARQYKNAYRKLMEKPVLTQNRFVYYFNKEAMAYVLYNELITHATCMNDRFKTLMEFVNDNEINVMFRDGMLADIKCMMEKKNYRELVKDIDLESLSNIHPALKKDLKSQYPQMFKEETDHGTRTLQ